MDTGNKSHPTSVEVCCPLCGSNRSRQLFDTRDYAFHCSDERFTLQRCNDCGCGYLSPRPPEHEIYRYYPKEFYWSWEGVQQDLSWSEVIEKRRQQLDAKATWLADLPPGRLLDIGAQKGEFIWYMRSLGWDVEGVELDNDVPNPSDMPIRYGDFLDMVFEPASYDCITFWAVLEHVYKPAAFIRKAAFLLKPGGRLVALVTNLQSIQARWYHADDYPRHLTIFTAAALRKLCRREGLRLVQVRTDQKIFGGALNGGLLYAVKRLGGYSQDEAFSEWKQPHDPDLFWGCWRSRPSRFVRAVSRLDRAITWPIEKLLDYLGFGFIMTFVIEKPHE